MVDFPGVRLSVQGIIAKGSVGVELGSQLYAVARKGIRFVVGEYAEVSKPVDISDGLAFLDNKGPALEAIGVRQREYRIVVRGKVETGEPLEIPNAQGGGADRDFKAPVFHRADVLRYRGEAGFFRKRNLVEEIFGGFDVVVQGGRETALQQFEVQTEVYLLGAFPAEFGVRKLERCHAVNAVVDEAGAVQQLCFVIAYPFVTGYGVGSPQFQVGDGAADARHEGFGADSPPHRGRRKVAVLAIGSEAGGAVATEGAGQQVFSPKIIGNPTEVRQ